MLQIKQEERTPGSDPSSSRWVVQLLEGGIYQNIVVVLSSFNDGGATD